MKLLLLIVSVLLVGCQSRPVANPAPVRPTLPPPAELPVHVAPPNALATQALERRIRQQSQFIEALVSQNEALTAKLNAPAAVAASPGIVLPAPADPVPSVAPDKSPPGRPAEPPSLVPNAEGVIDVAAAALAAKTGEPVNPFAVRTVSAEGIREETLRVNGIIAGPVACAVINDRLVQAGETIGSLTVESVGTDVGLLRHGAHRLRLSVSELPVRVRLPL